jgi:hypothetical protein
MTRCPLTPALLAGALALGGCARWQAYDGPRQPKAEVALLEIDLGDTAGGRLTVDGAAARRGDVRRIELLPGCHAITWTVVYPNLHRATSSIELDAEAGHRYRLGQRFFPAPHPAGPVGAAIETILDVALLPFSVLDPGAAERGEPPPGASFRWITDESRGGRVVAGDAPDVPLGHVEITFIDEP